MNNVNNCLVDFKNVSLEYAMDYGSGTFKEAVIRSLYRKKAVLRPEKFYALDNVNVTIHQGERIGIIGLNGSGKSTFLKVAAGILKPQMGSLEVVGNVQPLIEVGAGFNPEFSGRENIYLNGAMLGFSPAQIKEREAEIIEFAELENFIDIPVKHYSSGMAVRLAFTIATIIHPEILLMDEMLSAGDLSFIEKAKRRIEQILNKAKILILVSHDLGLVASVTTRCLVMEKGRIVFDGPTQKALDFYHTKALEKIEEGRSKEQIEVSQDNLLIRNVRLTIPEPLKLSPDSKLQILVGFDSIQDFKEIFINVTVKNRVGLQMLHFRNDFQGIKISSARPGHFEATVVVPKFPLKSDTYDITARVVGIGSIEQVVVDSKMTSLTIQGAKKRDTIVENSWTVSGPAEILSSIGEI